MGCKGGDTWNRSAPSAGEGQTGRLPLEGLLTHRERRRGVVAHGGGEQVGPEAVSAPVDSEDRAARRSLPGSSGVLALAEHLSLPAMNASRRASTGLGWRGCDRTVRPCNDQRAFQNAHLSGAAAEVWGYRQPHRAPEPPHRIFYGTYPIPRKLTTLSGSRREFPVQLVQANPYTFLL